MKGTLKRVHWVLIVTGLLLAGVGCAKSGGSSRSSEAVQPASVRGNVVTLNGSSSDVDGVEVEMMETGAVDISDKNGSFDLGDVPSGEQELMVTVRNADGSVLVTFVVVVVFFDGELVSIRISIEGEVLVRLSVERSCRDRDEVETRSMLQPTALGSGLEGHVEIEKDNGDDQKFELEVEDHLPGEMITVRLTDSMDDVEEIDALADDDGKVKIELESGDGNLLPFGVMDVSELEGVQVEVVDDSGDVLLNGTVPRLGSMPSCDDNADDFDDGESREGRSRLTNAPGVSGEADVELRRDVGEDDERFETEVEDTNVAADLELWLEDPNDIGVLVLIGRLIADDDESDEVELRRRTKDGEALPFGVATVEELADLAVEIRRTDNGEVVFSGRTPLLRRA